MCSMYSVRAPPRLRFSNKDLSRILQLQYKWQQYERGQRPGRIRRSEDLRPRSFVCQFSRKMLACRNASPNVYRWLLASPCHRLATSRRTFQSASKTKEHDNPFPYPTHRNPTPHQLFHLPHNATEADIKSRCMCAFRICHFLT